MDKTTKKQWDQPELIVLVRGTPEEGVLTGCRAGAADPGMGGSNNNQGPGCGWNSCRSQCSSNQRS
jgi:hypothetical protein